MAMLNNQMVPLMTISSTDTTSSSVSCHRPIQILLKNTDQTTSWVHNYHIAPPLNGYLNKLEIWTYEVLWSKDHLYHHGTNLFFLVGLTYLNTAVMEHPGPILSPLGWDSWGSNTHIALPHHRQIIVVSYETNESYYSYCSNTNDMLQYYCIFFRFFGLTTSFFSRTSVGFTCHICGFCKHYLCRFHPKQLDHHARATI